MLLLLLSRLLNLKIFALVALSFGRIFACKAPHLGPTTLVTTRNDTAEEVKEALTVLFGRH